MRRVAFSIIELIFVIVIIGILSAIMIPKMGRDSLSEAVIQLASHIRYTQHLAMVNDKYIPSVVLSEYSGATATRNAEEWYKGRWQLAFHKKTVGSDYKWSYSIFSDGPGTVTGYTGNPDKSEIAKNPLNPNKLLTGGYSAGTVAYDDEECSNKLNLGHAYGIEDIVMQGGCDVTDDRNQRIAFDHLGRPMYDKINDLTSSYLEGNKNLLITSPCQIKLCTTMCSDPKNTANNINEALITVLPETGYLSIVYGK